MTVIITTRSANRALVPVRKAKFASNRSCSTNIWVFNPGHSYSTLRTGCLSVLEILTDPFGEAGHLVSV